MQNDQYLQYFFQYQKPTADTDTNTDTKISNHAMYTLCSLARKFERRINIFIRWPRPGL